MRIKIGVILKNSHIVEEALLKVDEYPLFDMDHALRCSINERLLFAIVRNFISESKQGGIFALNQAYNNRDWLAVAALVSQIWQHSLGMGTIRMTHACEYFTQCYNNEQKFLYQLYPQLLEVIEQTITELVALSDKYHFQY